jgi:hypothetical protein
MTVAADHARGKEEFFFLLLFAMRTESGVVRRIRPMAPERARLEEPVEWSV